MDPESHSAPEICDEIAGELRDIGYWLSGGQLTPEQFRQAILMLEDVKVKRYGFRLDGHTLQHGKIGFDLRFAKSGEPCARMVFDPASGNLSTDHLCEQ